MNHKLFFKKLSVNVLIILFLLSFIACNTCCIKAKASEISRLENGEIIAKSLSKQLKAPLRGAEAKVIINAPVEKVWCVIENQEKYPLIFPKFKKVSVLETKNSMQKIVAAIKLAPILPTFKYILLIDETDKYKKIKFNKIEGCFNKLYGVFELEPYGNNKTIFTYRMFFDSGIRLPDFVGQNGLTKDLPEIMKNVKKRAENL